MKLLTGIAVLVSLLILGLFGWIVDLHRLATVNWDFVEHEDDIPPKKLLWLSIATGVLEVAAVALSIGVYVGSWPLYEWTMPIVVLVVLYAEALWLRYYNEPYHPYGL